MWQPIASAQKDRRVLLYVPGDPDYYGIVTGKWNQHAGCWECDPNEASEYAAVKMPATHWMPLPEPPTDPAQNPARV